MPSFASRGHLERADCRPIWMNEPFLSVFVSNFRVAPSVCSIVIVAPSTGFPCASTTVPVMMPCAAAGRANPRTTKAGQKPNAYANRLENRRTMRTLLRNFQNVRVPDSLHEFRSEEGRGEPDRARPAPAAATRGTAARNPSSGAADRGRPARRGRAGGGSAVPGPAGASGWPAAPDTRRTARRRARGWRRFAPP